MKGLSDAVHNPWTVANICEQRLPLLEPIPQFNDHNRRIGFNDHLLVVCYVHVLVSATFSQEDNKVPSHIHAIFAITMLIDYSIIVFCVFRIRRVLRSGPTISTTTRRLNRAMDRVLMFNVGAEMNPEVTLFSGLLPTSIVYLPFRLHGLRHQLVCRFPVVRFLVFDSDELVLHLLSHFDDVIHSSVQKNGDALAAIEWTTSIERVQNERNPHRNETAKKSDSTLFVVTNFITYFVVPFLGFCLSTSCNVLKQNSILPLKQPKQVDLILSLLTHDANLKIVPITYELLGYVKSDATFGLPELENMLLNNTLDLIAMRFQRTEHRQTIFAFTEVMYYVHTRLLRQKRDHNLTQMWSFFRTYDTKIWLLFAAAVLAQWAFCVLVRRFEAYTLKQKPVSVLQVIISARL
ncbi:hypothetical protein M3Y98_01205000 [Aphelenchoides besseyi]|nr:hypothetical protein M3Y98_01205000 [Aphelenchoides besseyi]